jgi:hypothetical protein
MKLFIWDKVLESYSYGIAVAAAESVGEARRVIAEEFKRKYPLEKSVYPNGWKCDYDNLVKDLLQEPEIRDLPAGALCQGGG